MRIVRFRMYGYKRLIPGLGKDTIEIEFKNNNTICIINGPNGIGKSTILNAMTPLPDTNDNFVEGKNAGKTIVYDNGYSIDIQNNVKNGTRQTSKAYMSKHGIELNPTGNISSYKDLLFSEFGLDPCYVPLTSLSNDDKGIATKTPSVRKKIFNSLLSNMEVYNNINKTMVKRSNIFKSMINNITSKIASIGDDSKLTSLLTRIENELNVLETNKNNIIKSIAESEANIKSLDPTAEIQTNYEKVNNNIQSLRKELDNIKNMTSDIPSYKVYYQYKVEELCKILDNTKINNEKYINMEKDISKEVDKLLNTQQEELQFHQTKVARLNGLKADVDFDKLQEELSSLVYNINKLSKVLKDNNVYNLSSSKLYYLSDKLSLAKDQIEILKSEDYYYDYIKEVVYNEESTIFYIDNKIKMHNDNISKIDEEINTLSAYANNLEEFKVLEKFKDLIPKECENTNNCELCKKINTIQLNEYYSIKDKLNHLITEKDNNTRSLNKYITYKKIEDQVYNIEKSISSVYNEYNDNRNLESTGADSLVNKDIIIDEINRIRELGNYKNRLESLEIEYSKKSADYELYKNKLDLIKEVEEDIKILDSRLDNITQSIEINNEKLVKIRECIEKGTKQISELSNILEYKKKIEEYENQISLEMKTLSVLEHSMSDINIHLKNIEDNNARLSEIYNTIKTKTSDKERIKYSLSMLEEYNTELSIYKEKYDMIETIKYYSSPTTGIQTLFMKLYMSNTLNICNDILSKMFNGELLLDEYVINENEFRIPCINNNMYIDDISSMSSSQVSMISMIISMVLLKQSSSEFNIVRLDEIDAGLDTNNRIQFVNTCMELIKILEIDQVIMVSHNMMELNSINIDLIEIR